MTNGPASCSEDDDNIEANQQTDEVNAQVNEYMKSQQRQLNAGGPGTPTQSPGSNSVKSRPTPTRIKSVPWFERQSSNLVVTAPPSDVPTPPLEQDVQAGIDKDVVSAPSKAPPKELVAVFNANTPNGRALVRGLSGDTTEIVAIVRVFTSKNAKELLGMPGVTVKVADLLDEKAVKRALDGVTRAFLCLEHWEKFVSELEESQAQNVLLSCAVNNVKHLVFATFEDTKQLRKKGLKSQIVPDPKGRIQPRFKQMRPIRKEAAKLGVSLTHMITSYLDQENSKKCLCLIRGANGRLIVQPNFED